jgi:hypothetical protein
MVNVAQLANYMTGKHAILTRLGLVLPVDNERIQKTNHRSQYVFLLAPQPSSSQSHLKKVLVNLL